MHGSRLAVAVGLIAVLLALPGIARAQASGLDIGDRIDLNRAPLTELESLPITPEMALAIYRYRTYVSYFDDAYELMHVKGMTPAIFATLRPLIVITPDFEIRREELREEEQRTLERYFVLQRMLSNEGVSEGQVDAYVDALREPININDLSFWDLVSFQNVSPVDAKAILQEINQSGRIENERQLRSSTGLSYWGYRNLRDFVNYTSTRDKRHLSGHYQVRLYNTPYSLDQDDILIENVSGDVRNFDTNTYAGRMDLGASRPYVTNKLRLRFGRYWGLGYISHRNLGEEKWNETSKFFLELKDLPGTDTPLGRLKLNSAVAGNFSASFGQGLVFDATDFFSSRRTGFGFNPRFIGLRGDQSRSDEFTMRGLGVDASLGRVRGTFFYSQDDKDAILNPDGSFNSYFRMIPRVSNSFMASIRDDIESGVLQDVNGTDPFLPMRDVMDERVIGGNLKFEILPGTYVGATGVEIKTENNAAEMFPGSPVLGRWDPNPLTLVIDPGRLEDRDAEIGARYNSVALGNYRRVWGAEAQTVFKNVSLAAEYGKLETSTNESALGRMFGSGPEAFVANAYVQYENFNFLALYRDYDIGYDNPYNRAFSEDSRFEQTILDGNAFRLKNPYWAFLGAQGGTPSSKSERGFYLGTRYQPTRQATISAEFDNWVRKVDNAPLRRATLWGEYRPIFPVRFRVRHRFSARDESEIEDVRKFQSWETRFNMRVNLSRFDRVDLLFSTSSVRFAPRGRLNGPATGGDTQADSTSSAGIPGRAIMGRLTHNFSDFLQVQFAVEMYNGFLWNFEDNEFIVVDGEGFRNWVMLSHRLSEHMTWRLKWTRDHQRPRTYVDIRNFGSLVAPTPDATNARDDQSAFRFQLDFSF